MLLKAACTSCFRQIRMATVLSSAQYITSPYFGIQSHRLIIFKCQVQAAFAPAPPNRRTRHEIRHPNHPRRLQSGRTQPRHHAAAVPKQHVCPTRIGRKHPPPLFAPVQPHAPDIGRHRGGTGTRRTRLCLFQRHGGHRLHFPYRPAPRRHRHRRVRHLRRQPRFADPSVCHMGRECDFC